MRNIVSNVYGAVLFLKSIVSGSRLWGDLDSGKKWWKLIHVGIKDRLCLVHVDGLGYAVNRTSLTRSDKKFHC